MSGLGTTSGPVLACGEVRTCLLPTSDAVDERAAEQLLRLRTDERVRLSRHPNRYAVSPALLTGVDCWMPSVTGTRSRAVGTVTARAAIVEGRVLQSSVYFSAPACGPDRRQSWGRYLVRPGCLIPVGRLPVRSVAEGFLAGPRQNELDIGPIAESLTARISRHRILDLSPPLTTADTSLRWTATPAAGGKETSVLFTKADDGLRTVELRLPHATTPATAAGLCEDLALHDWLLTTVAYKLDGLQADYEDSKPLKVLCSLVDHLLHLWMPLSRVDRTLHTAWEELDENSGYSRQWNALAQRIRDQLVLRAVRSRSELLTSN
ncbi:SCO2521 family protein [Streptomyces sp. Caat 7-52]|uniref:SCO2521 family protein n=1 Tax=Streptomyces sp. Caat 7-52 TaxID=2949637 RepID=UPI0020358C3D|nr:SCO2521 family protein [Streptomyces sp. Caat 7-52]